MFKELENLDWYDGPLLSYVTDEGGNLYLASSSDLEFEGWSEVFVVVPMPTFGEHQQLDAREVLRAASESWYWDYGHQLLPGRVPVLVDRCLTADWWIGRPSVEG